MVERRIEFIDFEEFQKIYKNCNDNKMKLCLALGYGSGLRISEIVGLRKRLSRCCKSELYSKKIEERGRKLKKHFCSKCDKEVLINKAIFSKTEWSISPLTSDKINLEKHQIRIDEAKGGKWRVTVTSPLIKENMLKYLPIKIPRRTLQYRFDSLTKKILGKKMSFHILRHGFGNYQANIAHLPLPVVQGLMGHSRLDTTGIYTKVNPEFAVEQAWKGMGGK